MLICYWFVIAAASAAYFLAWVANKPKQTRDRATIVAFFAVYIGCVCCRSIFVGVDTVNYIRYFETGPFLGWDDVSYYGGIEQGFQCLSAVVSSFGGSRLFLFVCGLISLLPIAVLYYKESESGPLCCSFFLISLLFEFFFSGLRQGIAVGIGVISFLFVKKGKLVPFLAAVALAVSMHSSAIVLLALYPLYHVKITQKWIPVVVIAMVAIYLERDGIFNGILLPMFGGDYLSGYEYLSGSSNQGALSVLFIVLAFYSCLMLDPDKADSETLGLRNILLLAAVIHIFTPLHPVVCRMNYYFIPFIPLALSRVNSRVKPILKPVEQVAAFVLPAFFVAYFLFAKDDSLSIAPYAPFFL